MKARRCAVCRKTWPPSIPRFIGVWAHPFCITKPKGRELLRAAMDTHLPKRKRRENPPQIVGEIPGRLEKIFYRRYGQNVPRGLRGPYQHGFSSSAKILALSDGSLLIRPLKKGRRLWVHLPH